MGSMSVFHSMFGLFFLIFWIAIIAVPLWRIAVKAGYPGATSLLLWIPMVNIVFLWLFAFMKWPTERKVQLEYGGATAGKSAD